MKEIVCTNCKESFSVDDDHFNSKKMVFNCNFCKVEIKRNEESGEWEATESKPIPEKPKEPYKFTSKYEEEESTFQKPMTLLDFVKKWRDRVIMIGWLVAGYYFLMIFYVSKIDSFSFFAIGFNILKALVIGYFIGFLLECLAKHLENQQDIIKLLKKEGGDGPH
ncbi:MAG: hypothetical protein NE327_17700 [Lentisphaeraceae bacterium]|nr:hypothetical protein [Lentisphaeraceae bacterium]